MFHISCIQKWVKDGVYQQAALNDDVPSKEIPWHWCVAIHLVQCFYTSLLQLIVRTKTSDVNWNVVL